MTQTGGSSHDTLRRVHFDLDLDLDLAIGVVDVAELRADLIHHRPLRHHRRRHVTPAEPACLRPEGGRTVRVGAAAGLAAGGAEWFRGALHLARPRAGDRGQRDPGPG